MVHALIHTLNHGLFVMSLDFELYWGLRDVSPVSHYRKHFAREREIIPVVLEMFEQEGIHATWATVGLLFSENKEQMKLQLPSPLPAYIDKQLSPYPHIAGVGLGEDEQEDPDHYGLSLIRRIHNTRYQRISTHTFSHYYCREEGQDLEAFRADLKAAVRAAQLQDIRVGSIVFPRNQVNPEYLPLLPGEGIYAYRGNPPHALYKEGYSTRDPFPKRVLRLMDTYFNLSGFHTYAPEKLGREVPLNVPASHFLRSYSRKLALLEPLRLRRILTGMTYAAKHRQIYHLWCHPYNLVDPYNRNLRLLARIIDHYKMLNSRYGMESRNMEELSEHLLSGES